MIEILQQYIAIYCIVLQYILLALHNIYIIIVGKYVNMLYCCNVAIYCFTALEKNTVIIIFIGEFGILCTIILIILLVRLIINKNNISF